jgi:AraC family transcriptional activator of tynA and feaB
LPGIFTTAELEECAEALRDPAQRGRTVTEIALSHGFNNPSHFSRVFRARYKTTPREYRAERVITMTC